MLHRLPEASAGPAQSLPDGKPNQEVTGLEAELDCKAKEKVRGSLSGFKLRGAKA